MQSLICTYLLLYYTVVKGTPVDQPCNYIGIFHFMFICSYYLVLQQQNTIRTWLHPNQWSCFTNQNCNTLAAAYYRVLVNYLATYITDSCCGTIQNSWRKYMLWNQTTWLFLLLLSKKYSVT